MGWPLRKRARYGEFGGSWIYPMGDEHVSLGFVVGLEYADVELSAHDLLQEFKTHRLVRKILERRRAGRVGREDDHRGRAATPCRRRLNAPGLLLVGEGAGLVNVPRLKGIHYAIESGRLAAEAAFAALQRGEVGGSAGRARQVRRRAPRELRLEGPRRGAGTCGRRSTRASSWAARSRAR